jgi:transposase
MRLWTKNRPSGGPSSKRHTSAGFISFPTALVSKVRWAREIHLVLDNLSAYRTAAVQEFLAVNPKVRFPFTPTYSSWLNQVELWFAKINGKSSPAASSLRLPIWYAN